MNKSDLNENNSATIRLAFERSGLNKKEFAFALKVSPGHVTGFLEKSGNVSDSLAELARIKFLTEEGQSAPTEEQTADVHTASKNRVKETIDKLNLKGEQKANTIPSSNKSKEGIMSGERLDRYVSMLEKEIEGLKEEVEYWKSKAESGKTVGE